jgi:hypothetical protein
MSIELPALFADHNGGHGVANRVGHGHRCPMKR